MNHSNEFPNKKSLPAIFREAGELKGNSRRFKSVVKTKETVDNL